MPSVGNGLMPPPALLSLLFLQKDQEVIETDIQKTLNNYRLVGGTRTTGALALPFKAINCGIKWRYRLAHVRHPAPASQTQPTKNFSANRVREC